MTNPLARLTAVWDRVVAACDPDRVTCGWVNETHEPMTEDDQ